MKPSSRRALPRAVFVTVALIVMASCSRVTSTEAGGPSTGSRDGAISSKCENAITEGTLPEWADAARVEVARYVIADDRSALGVLWADPLIAGEPSPEHPTNKILWIMNRARKGSDLTVLASLDGSTASPHAFTFEANSGPGEIYPTEIDLPEPGCWQLRLRWAGHETVVHVPYEQG